jgi:hypothetical protein
MFENEDSSKRSADKNTELQHSSQKIAQAQRVKSVTTQDTVE